MGYEYVDRTERFDTPDGPIVVRLVADMTGAASNPREWDNISEMVFLHRRYELGDRHELTYGEQEALDHGGFAALRKHLERRPDGLLALTKIGMYDHSGLTIYPVGDDGNGHYVFDSAGWDSGIIGFAFVTRKRADELGAPHDSAESQMLDEIKEYDDYLRGNVWGIVAVRPCRDEHDDDEEAADCPHAEDHESVWGFIGDPDKVWPDALESVGLSA